MHAATRYCGVAVTTAECWPTAVMSLMDGEHHRELPEKKETPRCMARAPLALMGLMLNRRGTGVDESMSIPEMSLDSRPVVSAYITEARTLYNALLSVSY